MIQRHDLQDSHLLYRMGQSPLMRNTRGKYDIREVAGSSTQSVEAFVSSGERSNGIRGICTDFEGRDV
jgi:hypothetical protein